MAFYFKKTKEDMLITQADEEDFKINDVCRFCEKVILSDNVHDHCQLRGKYRSPALSKCNINVTQDKSSIIPFIFHNLSNYDCHQFFKKLDDKENDKVKIKIQPKTNEEYISIRFGCIGFIDSYRILSCS